MKEELSLHAVIINYDLNSYRKLYLYHAITTCALKPVKNLEKYFYVANFVSYQISVLIQVSDYKHYILLEKLICVEKNFRK